MPDVNNNAQSSNEQVNEEVNEFNFEELTPEELAEKAKLFKKQADERLEALKRIQKAQEKKSEIKTDNIEELISKKAEEIFEKKQAESAKDTISEVLSSLSEDEEEQKQILDTYENVLKHTGLTKSAIKSDLERALALVNAEKLKTKTKEELEREEKKKSAEKATSNPSHSATRKPPKANKAHTPEEENFLNDIDAFISRRYNS